MPPPGRRTTMRAAVGWGMDAMRSEQTTGGKQREARIRLAVPTPQVRECGAQTPSIMHAVEAKPLSGTVRISQSSAWNRASKQAMNTAADRDDKEHLSIAHPGHSPCQFNKTYRNSIEIHSSSDEKSRSRTLYEEISMEKIRRLAEQGENLVREADHRLKNCLQMVTSFLEAQSRSATSDEVSIQLNMAANRVLSIEKLHNHIHSLDSGSDVNFKKYLGDFCHDFMTLIQSYKDVKYTIVVDCIDISLPTTTAIPLSYVVNELMTNAAKYGNGLIEVRVVKVGDDQVELSVLNDGPPLPANFRPVATDRLGMKIIRSFVAQIGGSLHAGPADNGQGARFVVRFPGKPFDPPTAAA
jgi:two-component sensor histidine kinase